MAKPKGEHVDIERVEFRLGRKLLRVINDKATEAGLPRNEFMAKILADVLGVPELGPIPRTSIGRPRKELKEPAAAAS